MHFDENNECILTFSVDWVLTLETFSEVVYQILYVHTKLEGDLQEYCRQS